MDKNRFYFLSLIASGILMAILFLVAFIMSLVTKNMSILFSVLLTIWMPFACIWLSKICNDSVFRMGKEGMGKGKLIFVSIILFTLKYIVVVVPLIVGLAVNNGTHRHYFDSIFLVVATLIYPLTTLVVQGYFVRISKKEHK